MMQKIKPYISYIIIAILILVFALSGSYGYKYHKKQQNALKDSLEVRKQKYELLEIEYLESEARHSQYDNNIKNYYNDYIKERNKRKALEQKLNIINTLEFSREYLDSLKRSIKYR